MYRVEFDPEAEQDLRGLDRSLGQQVLKRLRWLAENAEAVRHMLLRQRLRGRYKLRVGDYRVIYTLNRKWRTIRVHMIGHRDHIYEA